MNHPQIEMTPEIRKLLTPKLTKYIQIDPRYGISPKQIVFLLCMAYEAGFGGQAGGGKSWALLASALQFVDQPNYDALLIRRTIPDLKQPGALMSMAHEWLAPFIKTKEVQWKEQDRRFTFESGATLSFGYMENPQDRFQYQGARFNFVGFDEVTQFEEICYTYLFSRLRKDKDNKIPTRMRIATNPGGIGHEWVKKRFITERTPDRVFIFSGLDDNPYLDKDDYKRGLAELDDLDREQLEKGNWDAAEKSNYFPRSDWQLIDNVPEEVMDSPNRREARYWDLAATIKRAKQRGVRQNDPDETASTFMIECNGNYYITDVQAFLGLPAEVEERVLSTAIEDRNVYGHITTYIEEEPGSSGITTVDNYKRKVLQGFAVEGITSKQNKQKRAKPFSSAQQNHRVFVLRRSWTGKFLSQASLFPLGIHDDMIDSASGAFEQLVINTSYGYSATHQPGTKPPEQSSVYGQLQEEEPIIDPETNQRFWKPPERLWRPGRRLWG